MKALLCTNILFMLYALALYLSGDVLKALFWMGFASTALILSTSIRK